MPINKTPLTAAQIEITNPTTDVWEAGFIEFEFDLMGRIFKATTLAGITPFSQWPVEDCTTPEECQGCLV